MVVEQMHQKKKLGIHEGCIEIVRILEDKNGFLKLGRIVS
jgi:hypothetical protein